MVRRASLDHGQRGHRMRCCVRAIAATSLLALLCACSSLQVGTDSYPSFSFEGHDTFAWASDQPMVASSPDVSPFAADRIERAIVDAMQKRGIRYVTDPAQAKLLVAFSLSSKQKIDVSPAMYPAPYWGPYPWVGAYYGYADVREYSVGRLTIDVFDIEGRQPVWHGWASKVDGDDVQKGEGAAKAVGAILADFPPGTGRAPNA